MEIHTCEICHKSTPKYAVIKKTGDSKTKPKSVCSKDCLMKFFIEYQWKRYNIDCINTEDVANILSIVNDLKKIP